MDLLDDLPQGLPALVVEQLGALATPGIRPGDARVLFGALARACEGREHEWGMTLAGLALNNPSWRLEAVARHPELFRAARHRGEEWHTPLHELAIRDTIPPDETPEGVRCLVDALEAAGVPQTLDSWGRSAFYRACTEGSDVTAHGFAEHYGHHRLAMEKDGLGGVCSMGWPAVPPASTFENGGAGWWTWGSISRPQTTSAAPRS